MKFRVTLFAILSALTTIYSGCKEVDDLIFHESFEQYELGVTPRGPWERLGNGIVKVDTTKSYSGDFSVYIESSAGFDQRALINLSGNPMFPFAYNRIKGSFYVWLEDPPTDGVQWTLIQASGPVKGRRFSSSIRYGGQYRKKLMANYDTDGAKSDCYQYSNAILPEKEWVKVSWQFDGWQGTTKFWLNDQLIENLCTNGSGHTCMHNDLDGKWLMPVFTDLSIGWVSYQSEGDTQRLWIDDIKLYY